MVNEIPSYVIKPFSAIIITFMEKWKKGSRQQQTENNFVAKNALDKWK